MKSLPSAPWPFPRMKSFAVGLWRESVRPLLFFFLVAAPLKSAVVDWNWVPTGSMKPTIMVGDLVLVNKLAYDLRVPFTTWHFITWAEPERGDIIVFFSPKDGTRLVKRVVGLPGDTIQMQRDALFVNGIRQGYTPMDSAPFLRDIPEDDQPVVAEERLGACDHLIVVLPSRAAMRTFGPVVVPMGAYFMMGDSRDNSLDSRYFGSVPRGNILGRATTVIVSFDASRYLMPRLSRFFHSLSAVDFHPAAFP